MIFAPASQCTSIRTKDNNTYIVCMPKQDMIEFARFGIPKPNGRVPTSTNQGAAVRSETNTQDDIRMPGDGIEVGASLGIPNTNSRIPSTSGECTIYGIEIDFDYVSRMFGNGHFRHSRVSVPQADGVVFAYTRQRVSVLRRKGEVEDKGRVAGKNHRLRCGFNIPKVNLAVIIAAGKCFPIRTESDCLHKRPVPRYDMKFFSRGDIPQARGLIPTPGCEHTTVRTERYGVDAICVSIDSSNLFSRFNIPKADGAVVTRADDHGLIRTDVYAADTTPVPLNGLEWLTRLGIP